MTTFPNSPQINATHTVGSRTWRYDGRAWKLIPRNTDAISEGSSNIFFTNDRVAASPAVTSLTGRISAAEGNLSTLSGGLAVEKGRVDAILSAADADKDSFVEIVNLINSVSSSSDSTFAGYVVSNNAAVSSLDGRISTAEGEIDALQSGLASESAARAAADSTQQAAILAESASRSAEISAEAAARASADSTLQASITAEIASRAAAISAEAGARTSADAALGQRIDYLQSNLDPAQLDSIAEAAASISGIQSSLDTVNARQRIVQARLYHDNAQVVSNGQPGVEDPSPLVRPGWYFTNSSAGQKINWYFWSIAQPGIPAIPQSQFSAYTVLTLDSLGSSPFITLYSAPTGSGDAYPGFYHSAWVYQLPAAARNSITAGSKVLLYAGQNPDAHPGLARYELVYVAGASHGDRSPSEVVAFSALHSDSGSGVGSVKWLVESIGVQHSSLRLEIALAIRPAAISGLSAVQGRVTTAEGNIATLTSGLATEKGRVDAILNASQADKDSFAEIVTLINSVDTANDQAFAGYVLSNDAAVAAVASRATTLEEEMDAAEAEIATKVDTSIHASDIGTLQGQITGVDARVVGLEFNLDGVTASRITDIETSISNNVTAQQVALDTKQIKDVISPTPPSHIEGLRWIDSSDMSEYVSYNGVWVELDRV